MVEAARPTPLAHARAFCAPDTTAAQAGAGVCVAERRAVGLATILLRRGQAAALTRNLGWGPPSGPRVAHGQGLALIGLGPASWLAVAADPTADFAARLAARLTPAASVSDQSSAYGLLWLTGPAAGCLLAKGVFLDLDRFAAGDAVTTQIAHMNVLLWREENGWTLACARSCASSLWHWILTNAAEFGLAHTD